MVQQTREKTRSGEEKKETEKAVSREELLTVREVARRLRVDDTTVRRWIRCGALEAITLPHSGKRRGYRVRKFTVDALFAPGSPMPV